MPDRLVPLDHIYISHDAPGAPVLATTESNGVHTLAVSGGGGSSDGLTDAQLRASPVPTSTTNGLTDTQLRASAVPVSGPLTDTQLRATALPVTTPDNTVTGTITAINTGVSVSTVGKGAVTIQVEGTYTGALTPQARVGATSAWVTLSSANAMVRDTGAYTATVPSAATGIFQVDATGFTEFRLYALSAMTGTATINMRAVAASSLVGLDTSLPAGTATIGAVTISGTPTVTVSSETPATPTTNFYNSAATTNATSVKTAAGTVYNIEVSNVAASPRYLKLYNKASAPTVGTDIPVMVIPIAAGTALAISGGTLGIRFGTGIALAITGAAADTDTTAVAAADVKVAIAYL